LDAFGGHQKFKPDGARPLRKSPSIVPAYEYHVFGDELKHFENFCARQKDGSFPQTDTRQSAGGQHSILNWEDQPGGAAIRQQAPATQGSGAPR
jgi:hypothetical protein